MKKIYILRANKTIFGGAENYLSRFANSMNKKNYEFEIINSPISKKFPSWFRAVLFNIIVCFKKKEKFYFSLERISCPDVYRAGDGVHRAFLRLTEKSKFNLLHPIYLYLEKKCFNNAKKIIANSKMIKNQIVEEYGVEPKNIEVVYNGIDTNKRVRSYKYSAKEISKEFNVDLKKPIFLYVGNGFKRKGVQEFVNILKKIHKRDFLAFIIGADKDMDFYQNMVSQSNLNGKIIFTGQRKDVDKFFSVSDFFILPTYYDPFSNVILEAMFFKNIVFTTQNNGASEILNKKFIMRKPTDFSVIQTINSLLDDERAITKIKEYNHSLSLKYSISANLTKTIRIINEVIN